MKFRRIGLWNNLTAFWRIFHHTNNAFVDPTLLLGPLRDAMNKQNPVQTQHHGNRSTTFHATYVSLRHDADKAPLQRPYDGPFMVVKRREKYFTLTGMGTVSLDRLKPPFIDHTRSERPPKQFTSFNSLNFCATSGADADPHTSYKNTVWSCSKLTSSIPHCGYCRD